MNTSAILNTFPVAIQAAIGQYADYQVGVQREGLEMLRRYRVARRTAAA